MTHAGTPCAPGSTSAAPPSVRLRPTTSSDVPTLFQIQLDPEGNRLAGAKPRDLETFNSHWAKILADPGAAAVVPRVILAGDVVVGSINLFKLDGADLFGYWLAREHWGRGIATRAIALFLEEVRVRPLSARVATYNTASLRALERNGFVVTDRREIPESDRFTACEKLILTLR